MKPHETFAALLSLREDLALALTAARALDTTLSQTAMRFQGRLAFDAHYNGLAFDMTEGERIAHAMLEADVVFLGNKVSSSAVNVWTTPTTISISWSVPARRRCWRLQRVCH